MLRKAISELLFWFHLYIIVFTFVLSWVLPFGYLILGVLVHQLHIKVFRGCIITNLQKKVDKRFVKETFLDLVAQRFFLKELNGRQLRFLIILLASLPPSLALIHILVH